MSDKGGFNWSRQNSANKIVRSDAREMNQRRYEKAGKPEKPKPEPKRYEQISIEEAKRRTLADLRERGIIRDE